MILAAACGLSSLAALAVGAWAIETRLAALWRADQRRRAAARRP
ncbi:hypothetical protein OG795_15280 [[Kitasatospora] papulosa]